MAQMVPSLPPSMHVDLRAQIFFLLANYKKNPRHGSIETRRHQDQGAMPALQVCHRAPLTALGVS